MRTIVDITDYAVVDVSELSFFQTFDPRIASGRVKPKRRTILRFGRCPAVVANRQQGDKSLAK